MRTIFVAGSRKYYEDIEAFVRVCKKHNLNAQTPQKEKGRDDFETEKTALLRAFKIIDGSDAVYIFARKGYVGKTVSIEMGYAYARGKAIYASEQIDEPSAQALVTEIVTPAEFVESLA